MGFTWLTIYDMLDGWTLAGTNGERLSVRRRMHSQNLASFGNRRVAGAASPEVWQRSLNATSSNVDVPDELRLLRDAQNPFDRRQFRKVVIDAGTAVELALTRVLESRITDPTAAQALLEKYRMLGGRITLAKKYQVSLPPTLDQDLVQPRNAATHGYVQLSNEVADKALKLARDVVGDHVPLP